MDEAKINQTADLLKVIAHPARLKILLLLARLGPRNVTFIQDVLQLEQSLVSHHLIKLKDRGILICERWSKEIYYQVNPSLAKELPRLLAERVGYELPVLV